VSQLEDSLEGMGHWISFGHRPIFDVARSEPDTQEKKEGQDMNFNLNLSSLESLIRNLGKYLVVINDATNTVHMPTAVKSVLTAVAGVVFALDHQAAKKSVS
jgi:hypothetical protein